MAADSRQAASPSSSSGKASGTTGKRLSRQTKGAREVTRTTTPGAPNQQFLNQRGNDRHCGFGVIENEKQMAFDKDGCQRLTRLVATGRYRLRERYPYRFGDGSSDRHLCRFRSNRVGQRTLHPQQAATIFSVSCRGRYRQREPCFADHPIRSG